MVARKVLSVDAILAAPLPERVVDVPEWGGAVRVRAMTKAAQQAIRQKAHTADGQVDSDKWEMLLFIHCVVEPRFTEEQYEELRTRSARAIDNVVLAIMEVSGLTEGTAARAQESFRAWDVQPAKVS